MWGGGGRLDLKMGTFLNYECGILNGEVVEIGLVCGDDGRQKEGSKALVYFGFTVVIF